MKPAQPASGPGPSGVSAPPDALLYLYAIADAVGDVSERLASAAAPGLDAAEPLFGIEAAGLLAIVSRVPCAVFQEEPLNALVADIPRLAPYVVGHEEVVRTLAGASVDLIPMSFGAVYRSAERVEALLTERSEEFKAVLNRLRGRVEWGLKLFVDAGRLLAAAGATAELRSLTGEIGTAAPGRAYLLGKRRERLLAAEARRLLDETVEQILGVLGPLCVAVRREETVRAADDGPQLALKAEFLLERESAVRFRSAAAALRRSSAMLGCLLELNGPWAPYSFVGNPGRNEGESCGGA